MEKPARSNCSTSEVRFNVAIVNQRSGGPFPLSFLWGHCPPTRRKRNARSQVNDTRSFLLYKKCYIIIHALPKHSSALAETKKYCVGCEQGFFSAVRVLVFRIGAITKWRNANDWHLNWLNRPYNCCEGFGDTRRQSCSSDRWVIYRDCKPGGRPGGWGTVLSSHSLENPRGSERPYHTQLISLLW